MLIDAFGPILRPNIVSRLEGTGTLSLGQQCYIREAVTRRVIAVKNGTDPTNGCIEGVAVFGVGIGLGSSSGSGGYFVATIPNGPTIGKLVNAFAPERVTSILDRFPRIITESGFNGVLEITFAAQAMTLGEVGSYRSLPRGVAASGTFMLLGFNTTATALIDPGRQFLVQADFSMGPNFGELLSFRGGSLIVNITGPGGFTPPEHVYVALEGTLRVLYTDVSAAMVIDDTSMRAEFIITNLFTVPGTAGVGITFDHLSRIAQLPATHAVRHALLGAHAHQMLAIRWCDWTVM